MTTTVSKFAMDPSIPNTQQDESKYLSFPVVTLLCHAEKTAARLGQQWVTIKLLIAILAANGPWTSGDVPYLYQHMELLAASESARTFRIEVSSAFDDVIRGEEEDVPVQGFSDTIADAIRAAHEIRRLSREMWTSLDHLALSLLVTQEAEFLVPILEKLHISRQKLVEQIAANVKPRKDKSWSPLCDRLWGKRDTCPRLLSICDDMGKQVERKGIHRFPGRGKEVRDIKQRLSGGSPKLAIIGPHGSGKTQLVNDIAVSFAQDEPLSGPGDFPFITRLLSLNLSLLIAEEAHQEGWASTKLRAAKKEIENASQHRGKDGQGVQFVIVVDGLYRALIQPSLALSLSTFLTNSKFPIICLDTPENWAKAIRCATSLANIRTISLEPPSDPRIVKAMAITISTMLSQHMGVMINDSTIVDCIDLISRSGSPVAFPGSFEQLLRAASVLEIDKKYRRAQIAESEEELEVLESDLEWLNRWINFALPGAEAKRALLTSEVIAKKGWIKQQQTATKRDHERNELERSALSDRWNELEKELKNVHNIENWHQLDANRHDPAVNELYLELYTVDTQKRCFDRYGRPAPLVTIASLQQAAKEISKDSA